jgi:anaerobic ribonucleoside-triphosphate reductase activating protein
MIQALTLRDGYGLPAPIIYFQGCHIHCSGCHNPELWDPNGGIEVSTFDVINKIKERLKHYKAIVYQGGEPTDQAEDLIALMKEFHVLGLKNILYSGLHYDEIPNEILEHTDILKCGPYGSAQQTIYLQEDAKC